MLIGGFGIYSASCRHEKIEGKMRNDLTMLLLESKTIQAVMLSLSRIRVMISITREVMLSIQEIVREGKCRSSLRSQGFIDSQGLVEVNNGPMNSIVACIDQIDSVAQAAGK